ncbi:hypothetical protein, partial [Pseudomonas aeruginosa]|uniref:hypothetical protein n=1 Tax=Pseudomonas aeruginosa TaxID=287 RepID=UPI0030055109
GDENHRHRRLVEGDGGVKARLLLPQRGAKALHTRSEALPALILVNNREVATPRSNGLKHAR